MLSILPVAPQKVIENLKTNLKKKRKALGYSQAELASRSGVSLGSLKRFEQTGKISLESLLQLALVLECLDEFQGLCTKKEERYTSIEEIIDDK